MPTLHHELIVSMIRGRPALASRLLTLDPGFSLPEHDRVELMSADLTDITPTEYRADSVVKVIDGAKLVYAVIVEVQQRADRRKRFAWPAYVGTLYSRLKCPVYLLVACPSDRVARWCAEPISIGDPPYYMMSPSVINLRRIPPITDVAVAEKFPELIVLSVSANGGMPEPGPLLKAFAVALKNVDSDHADLYLAVSCRSCRVEARSRRRSGKARLRPDTGVVSGRSRNAAGRRLGPPQAGNDRQDTAGTM